VQGGSGQTGDRGLTGIAGDAGPSGLQGEQGETGPAGAQGAVGTVKLWTAYQEFNFNRTSADISALDMNTVSDIAAYLARNPSLEVGIDGSMDTRRSNQQDRDLSNHRADSVRDALMKAGVPADKIQMGAFADPDRRQLGQILVLIKTQG
jgi:outer membrane protein OmpA-like peptidoglycan-associated protein